MCKPCVCHKGRYGRCGWCRMYYWHVVKLYDPKKGCLVAKRQHGLQLHPRWDGVGPPPTLGYPHVGLPALETTHQWHFKLSYAILLGPQCNHDVQVLPRLCSLKNSSPDAVPDEVEVATVKAGMVEQQAANEFYCSSYSSKSAPHAEGLLLSLAVSLEHKERDAREAARRGEEPHNVHEQARKKLHALQAATNNRMHKGFPEIISYLLQEPTLYSSHEFVTALTPDLDMLIKKRLREVATGEHASASHAAARPYSTKLYKKPFLREHDYLYRPDELEDFPLFFFFAACEARQARPDGSRPVNAMA